MHRSIEAPTEKKSIETSPQPTLTLKPDVVSVPKWALPLSGFIATAVVGFLGIYFYETRQEIEQMRAEKEAQERIAQQEAQARFTAPAASADTPPIKTGDTYIIESLYPDNPKLNSTTERKVISVGDGKITVASKNIKSKTGSARTIQFTPEWNLISARNPDGSGLDYSPSLKYFEFPLYPGKTWRQTSMEKNIKTGAVREHTLSATVGDWEDVSVSAGTFRAIKITTQTELLDRATGQRSTGTDISWYAPNIRRSVTQISREKRGIDYRKTKSE